MECFRRLGPPKSKEKDTQGDQEPAIKYLKYLKIYEEEGREVNLGQNKS